MSRTPVALALALLAVCAWVGFGFLLTMLHKERAAYAETALSSEEVQMREESAARLRATIQSTESERAQLESVIGVSIIQIAETIEAVGKQAGASSVTIGEATPISVPAPNIGGVAVVLNAQGSFVSLMRFVTLLEVLPIPSLLDQVEIAKVDKDWRLVARLRVTSEEKK